MAIGIYVRHTSGIDGVLYIVGLRTPLKISGSVVVMIVVYVVNDWQIVWVRNEVQCY